MLEEEAEEMQLQKAIDIILGDRRAKQEHEEKKLEKTGVAEL